MSNRKYPQPHEHLELSSQSPQLCQLTHLVPTNCPRSGARAPSHHSAISHMPATLLNEHPTHLLIQATTNSCPLPWPNQYSHQNHNPTICTPHTHPPPWPSKLTAYKEDIAHLRSPQSHALLPGQTGILSSSSTFSMVTVTSCD